MYICNSDIWQQNSHYKNLWTLFTDSLTAEMVLQSNTGLPLLLVWMRLKSTHGLKSHLYILFCEVPVPILCPFCCLSHHFRSAFCIWDLHFDFNKLYIFSCLSFTFVYSDFHHNTRVSSSMQLIFSILFTIQNCSWLNKTIFLRDIRILLKP